MTKFTLYIGLNDKDTKRQEVQTLEAFKVSANIFKALTGGATISEAQGIYTHDNGDILLFVNLFVYYFVTKRNNFCTVFLFATVKNPLIYWVIKDRHNHSHNAD